MYSVKSLGMIFLAVYLILNGVSTIFGTTPWAFVRVVMDLFAIASGILILISIGKFCPHEEEQ